MTAVAEFSKHKIHHFSTKVSLVGGFQLWKRLSDTSSEPSLSREVIHPAPRLPGGGRSSIGALSDLSSES